MGATFEKQLFGQHNPNWVEHGEHQGKLSIFDNGMYRYDVDYDQEFSRGIIIDLPLAPESHHYYRESDAAFLPEEIDFFIAGNQQEDIFYSGYVSGHEILPNGNSHLTIGDMLEIREYTPDKKMVWKCTVPYGYWNPFHFRSEKYPVDFPGFENVDLTPSGYLGGFEPEVPCGDFVSAVDDLELSNSDVTIRYDSAGGFIELEGEIPTDGHWLAFGMDGRALKLRNADSNLRRLYLEGAYQGCVILIHQTDKNKIGHQSKVVIY